MKKRRGWTGVPNRAPRGSRCRRQWGAAAPAISTALFPFPAGKGKREKGKGETHDHHSTTKRTNIGGGAGAINSGACAAYAPPAGDRPVHREGQPHQRAERKGRDTSPVTAFVGIEVRRLGKRHSEGLATTECQGCCRRQHLPWP